MALTTRQFAGSVLAASVLVLGAALLSQYWGGLTPCELCLLERWPWWVAIAIAAAAWLTGGRLALPIPAILLAIVFLASAGDRLLPCRGRAALVRRPYACTEGSGDANSVEALRAQLLGKKPVMCDEVQWSLFGISLAGWNLLASIAMAGFCAMTARRCGLWGATA
jgi:disulfide bond formation protein DsbB